jgi:Fe-S-cluster containining protein
MTPDERDLLLARRPDLATQFVAHAPGFVALQPIDGTRQCPLLAFEGGLASCTVHDIRPLNCRRFQCGRVVGEAFEEDPPGRAESVMGCANLTDRVLQSRAWRRQYAQHQRKAMRTWGLKHGWRDDLPRATE